MTDTTTGLRSLAYVNHGRWVADCAVCPSALELTPGQVTFVCLDRLCGETSAVVWPAEVALIESLLAERPARNRNWHPWETAEQLLAENIEHGVTPVKGL